MITLQQVRCPNCGNFAERQHILEHHLVSTACSHCDYLLVSCSLTGNVLECYAPG
ncbi:MAG: replication restart DNA helicase PriA, partial [bacterium]